MHLCHSMELGGAQREKVIPETLLACPWLSQYSSSPDSPPRAVSPAQSSPIQGTLECGWEQPEWSLGLWAERESVFFSGHSSVPSLPLGNAQ